MLARGSPHGKGTESTCDEDRELRFILKDCKGVRMGRSVMITGDKTALGEGED